MFGGTSQAGIWEKSLVGEGMQEQCSEVGASAGNSRRPAHGSGLSNGER